MYYVCLSSFGIVTEGHFTWLHGLSAFTILTVTLGLLSAVRRNVPAHRGNMIGSYLGIAIAFGFAVGIPGRSIPRLLAADPATALYVVLLVVLSVAVVYLSMLRGGKGFGPAHLASSKRDEGRRGAEVPEITSQVT
ncbi:hypothetical protein SAMN05444745_101138 [Arthrobacter sp. OV608]|nr:hypothetical protein SAMN05444745_101138 [Arthrobacter sp. OV608]